ncbi:MAG: type IV pilin protein [Gemmatimonadota bacterium]
MNRKVNGFTLIELLIVTVIIAILAAIAIPYMFGTKERAFIASMRNDLRNLETAQEAYYVDYHQYTGTLADLADLFYASPNVSIALDSASATGWGATSNHPGTSAVCNVAVSQTTSGNPVCS